MYSVGWILKGAPCGDTNRIVVNTREVYISMMDCYESKEGEVRSSNFKANPGTFMTQITGDV